VGVKTEALEKFLAFATIATTVGRDAVVGCSERGTEMIAALDRGFFCFIAASGDFADEGGGAFSFPLIAGLPRFFAGASSCVEGSMMIPP
jgi:hypothetical protein